ncbi:MAG: RagB/SusD family protein [Chitinophaga sp.]|nr:RagB/SusD family protein [Chitinophaga sp.]
MIAFKKKTVRNIWLMAAFSLAASSCKKLLDKQPETFLTTTQMYRNVYDADAAVIGVYGKLMGLAKQYIVLNELRADLMQVTDNADADLREISSHTVSATNPYANPRPFYAVINDCNDVLKNLKIMVAANKIKQAEFDQRYSDIGCLRSWLYLQVGIHWGNIPYVTDPLETIDAVKDASKFPIIPFNQLIDSLINFTNTLPYQQPYPMGASINTGLMTNFDGYSTRRFFIDKFALLGDLNLWKGNYTAAATYYRKLMEPVNNGYDTDNANSLYSIGGLQYYDQFKQPFASVTDNNDLCIGYIRFKESDINSFIDNNTQGWRSMFVRSQDANWQKQWVWELPFNNNFAPENPFINLFSNRGGSYLVKPSKQAIDNWNSQTQTNGFPFDGRGSLTYRTFDGQPVICKYLYSYLDGTTFLPANLLQKNGNWFLNRAANVHLKFAEAANRDGRRKLAYGFLNIGISGTFAGPLGTATTNDQTNYENTLYESFPYNFDARYGDAPRFRADWYKNTGIRGTARLNAAPVSGDSTLSIENSILTEGALELAYEGERWPDLVRIAIRRNDNSIVANAIFNKLSKDGFANAAAIQAKLMDRKNWYLPFQF